MRDIYLNLSSYITYCIVSAEDKYREYLRSSSTLLMGLLFSFVGIPEVGVLPTVELHHTDYSRRDLSAEQVIRHFEERLPAENKQDARRLGKLVYSLSERYTLSPGLILSVIDTESTFRYDAVSRIGAVGLMQLLPSTAAEVAKKFKIHAYESREDLFRPDVNIRIGVAYLVYLRMRFGHPEYYLAAYNEGPTTIRRRISEYNYQVADYVRKVQTRTAQIRD